MPSAARIAELQEYTGVLPYASELFGIYQPILGWKSGRTSSRFQKALRRDQAAILEKLKHRFVGQAHVRPDANDRLSVTLSIGTQDARQLKASNSILLQKLAESIPRGEPRPNAISELITRERLEGLLKDAVAPAYANEFAEAARGRFGAPADTNNDRTGEFQRRRMAMLSVVEERLRQESALAGTLLYLKEKKSLADLERMFVSQKDNVAAINKLHHVLAAKDAISAYLDIDRLDPQDQEQLRRVVLSPIGVVHLFRQYFFELDSFLGPSVGHVWLAPGTTAELIEVHSTKTITEKFFESSTETTTKSERETTEEEELSDAIKENNQQDISAGASVTATYAGVKATSTFDLKTTQQNAREESHKRTRKQSEKLSTEIRKNFRTTFRTVTETSDTSTKRYVIQNLTNDLLNYELRRKMRQIAVQVQDVGSFLCWQTYVDRPGTDLGLAKLVHIAKPPELDGMHAPDEIPNPQTFTERKPFTIPFVSEDDTDADSEGEVYINGTEVDNSEAVGTLEKIKWKFPVKEYCPKSGYKLAALNFDTLGNPVSLSHGKIENNEGTAEFTIRVNSIDFQGMPAVQVGLILQWEPEDTAFKDIDVINKKNLDKFEAKEQDEYRRAYVKAARERVKLSHAIQSRKSEDLRKEERIVIYRRLIHEMLANGIDQPDERTQHVVAELINSIFDIEKMLYFVAPEWWRPQMRVYSQDLNVDDEHLNGKSFGLGQHLADRARRITRTTEATRLSSSSVGWGGIDEDNRPNYYISEDSEPARFGSSLGWLLQLDGDDRRNAFLNAPWVKVVIPIRPGQEEAAINWLKGVEGMNGISDSDIYRSGNAGEVDIQGRPLNGQKMLDVIMDMALKIKEKHEQGIATGKYPKPSEITNPTLVDQANTVTSTPIDRVYEHGFYTLDGGFRANVQDHYEIFDQWLEIMPTDQVVPVEVKYDPKTGRML